MHDLIAEFFAELDMQIGSHPKYEQVWNEIRDNAVRMFPGDFSTVEDNIIAPASSLGCVASELGFNAGLRLGMQLDRKTVLEVGTNCTIENVLQVMWANSIKSIFAEKEPAVATQSRVSIRYEEEVVTHV